MKYQLILQSQKDFFHSGATLPVPYRLEVLSLLEGAIQNRQEQIESALAEDLGKSQQEAYSTEIAIVLSELRHAKRHLNSWARSKRVPVPLSHWPGRQQVTPVPYGSVLILAPWNYPFQLCLSPLISALAAGNWRSRQTFRTGGTDGFGHLCVAGRAVLPRIRFGLPG